MKKKISFFASVAFATSVAFGQDNTKGLQEGFTVDAASIGKPAADGVSGSITNTGGTSRSYRVRSMGGTWWMIQNADKPVSSGCTHGSINRDSYGHLYSRNCTEKACPSGWRLPSDEDFKTLGNWLSANNKWSEWNSGSALAGFGNRGSYHDYQGSSGLWWSSTSGYNTRWYVKSDSTSGELGNTSDWISLCVRCVKKPLSSAATGSNNAEGKPVAAIHVNAAGSTKDVLTTKLVNALVQTQKYSVKESSDAFQQQMEKEHLTSYDDDFLLKVGKQLGAQYICEARVRMKEGALFVYVSFIDVKTGEKPLKIDQICNNIEDCKFDF
jgi:uncharacterized protein (TIGR02145 family)